MWFHITTAREWERAQRDGALEPPSLREVGFVHLSTEDQWPRTSARFFAGRTDLVLLSIDPARVRGSVRFEQADGEAVPHLYAPLETSAVVQVATLALDDRGVPSIARR